MRRSTALAAVSVVAALPVVPDGAPAIPWDIAGAIPPSKTPRAHLPDPHCGQSYADDPPGGGPALRFGVGPRLAGEGGTANTTPPVPESFARRDHALAALNGRRSLFVRLNRLFMSDGDRGIHAFERLADRITAHGIDVELQVRYHPKDADNGNIGKWLAFVRRVVRAFGPNHRVTGLQITNEVNLTFSPNTSDGFYRDSVRALVYGVIAAKRESLRHHYRWQRIGFNDEWRSADYHVDARFWQAVARLGGKQLRRTTD